MPRLFDKKRTAMTVGIAMMVTGTLAHERTQDEILQQSQKFAKNAKNAYEMSMPLLAPSLIGNNIVYLENEKRFETLLEESKSYTDGSTSWMANKPFRMWMKGRQLIAAFSAGEEKRAKIIANEMQRELTKDLYAPNMSPVYVSTTPFAAWALSYLQTYYALNGDKEQYAAVGKQVKQALAYQRQHYHQGLDPKDPQTSFSDLMWSYAMALQSAGMKGDELTAQQYLQELETATNRTLEKNLKELSQKPTEYPIWLIASIKGSVQSLKLPHDKVSLSALDTELNKARNNKNRVEQDAMLGDAVEILNNTSTSSFRASL